MRELEFREKKVNDIQASGDRLIKDGHPGKKTVEVRRDYTSTFHCYRGQQPLARIPLLNGNAEWKATARQIPANKCYISYKFNVICLDYKHV